VMATIAVFLVLSGGTAVALNGANTVFSDDIVDGEVKAPDLGVDSVGSGKIIDRQVKNADLSIGASSSNTIADGGIQGIDVKSNTLTGAQVDESTLNGGGDVSGPLSNLQIGARTIGRSELASGAGPGCCVTSFFEFSVPANACTTKAISGWPNADPDLGEILIAFPESADLGAGVYLRPTVVAHPDEAILEICNSTGSSVTIPFGTFFQLRLIG
jgi:hypothetical protein